MDKLIVMAILLGAGVFLVFGFQSDNYIIIEEELNVALNTTANYTTYLNETYLDTVVTEYELYTETVSINYQNVSGEYLPVNLTITDGTTTEVILMEYSGGDIINVTYQ